MKPIPRWEFDVYALSLPRGHGFGNNPPIGAWQSADGLCCGIVTRDVKDKHFGFLLMRRRKDQVWTVIAKDDGFSSKEDALAKMEPRMLNGDPPEPVPPGVVVRPSLFEVQERKPSDIFKLLGRKSHLPAAWTLNQLYLALPKPDRNWASDCQTGNFHTRLWEAQLIAAFREQGLLVTQPFESPDFHIENRCGQQLWVEAVTANPSAPYNHFNAPPSTAPHDPAELFFGSAALRFAKTLGNKLEKRYDQLPHTKGQPFMIALADFQAPASMTWSREALIGYLYGEGGREIEINGQKVAQVMKSVHLLGDLNFPTGLFADKRNSQLSGVIFSNACSIAKLNRVAVSGRGAPEDFRYTRIGQFFDRRPGALRGTPFCFDVTSVDYRNLWPIGYEPWSAELEVFHNPFAKNPVNLDNFPEATNWFVENGAIVCSSFYETSILWSQTYIQRKSGPPFRLEDLENKRETPEE